MDSIKPVQASTYSLTPFPGTSGLPRPGKKDANQTAQQAKQEADRHVRDHFSKAKDELSQGDIKDAYYDFGLGLHTLQDATSPAHHGFQPWSDHISEMEEFLHVIQELFYPGESSNFQQVTEKWLEWFEGSDDALPSGNLFDNILSDPAPAPPVLGIPPD